MHVDTSHAARLECEPFRDWVPNLTIETDREMYIRCALGLHGVESVTDFYTPRNLRALARLWGGVSHVPDLRVRQALALAFTNTAWHGTRMRRFNARGGQRPLTGTLYIPQMSVEVNVASVFLHKIKQLARFFASEGVASGHVDVRLASAANLGHIESASVDYVFTDPPFGSNIFYADCALIAESWLGRLTDRNEEAVVNRSLPASAGGKTVGDYRALMSAAFGEIARVLKPRGAATIVFQNTDPAVWQALEDALSTAGLELDRAATLDKSQQSHKGYKGRSGVENVAAFDMVLTVRRRRGSISLVGKPSRRADAVGVLQAHLRALPSPGVSLEADRQRTLPYLYSVLLQAHFNGDIGLAERGYACVRDLCAASLTVDAKGRWQLRPSSEPLRTRDATCRRPRDG
jgi:hypothetical protein